MSVGGDDKGKRENEPNLSQDAIDDAYDGGNAYDGDEAYEADVPPYEAVTDAIPIVPPVEVAPDSTAPVDREPQTPESETPQPQTPESETPESETPQPQTPESETPQPQTPQPQTPESETPQPQTPEPEALEPEAWEPEASEPQAWEPEASEPEAPAHAGPAGGLVDPEDRSTAHDRVGPLADEPRADEPRADEPRSNEARSDERLADGLFTHESRSDEPPLADSNVHSDEPPLADSNVHSDAPPTHAYSDFSPQPSTPASHSGFGDPDAPTVANKVFSPVREVPSAADSRDQLDGDGKPSWMKIAVTAGAVVAVLGVFYTADMLSSKGAVPRGVTVAGIEVGGLGHDDAEARLRSDLGPRVEQPVQVRAGGQDLEFLPAAAGLDVDWNSTLDSAGTQPINPFTRLASFFVGREIGVQSAVDEAALDETVEQIRLQIDRIPAEGDVIFEGATPVAVAPAPGQTVDVVSARATVESMWASGTVELPVETVDVTVHQDEVDRVLSEIAMPAVSAPVKFEGKNNVDAVLAPDRVSNVLSFEPDGAGALVARYDVEAATAILAPQLVSTEIVPKDASFALGAGAPAVVPGVVGDLVQWPKTLEQLPALLASTDARTADAVYEPAPPVLTTEGAQALGIKEVIAEYTTGGFESASGINIGLTANMVNGALVKPGDTFSLNGYTGPRGTAQGFVESGIIDHGRPDRAVGGGISQFATTLYNASYFGGMADAGHTEHSYYISRYPEAREATVFEGAIDLKFTNATKTGVVIESFATSSDVTVKLWGTKTVDVESSTGPRTKPTSPNTITLSAGDQCIASKGGPGFTASDTRVVTDIASGNEISRNTRTVKYDPIPIVKCESPEPERKPDRKPEPEPEPKPAETQTAPAPEPAPTPAVQPTPEAPKEE